METQYNNPLRALSSSKSNSNNNDNKQNRKLKNKKRRDSEAHSKVFFHKTLHGFGIKHKSYVQPISNENVTKTVNKDIDKELDNMPNILYFNTIVFSIITISVLLTSSFLAYEASKEVVADQFQTISGSACRTAKYKIQGIFDNQILLAKQLAGAIGRREGVAKANTKYFKKFNIGDEIVFGRTSDIFGARMVYFGSDNDTFIGTCPSENFVSVLDESTNFKRIQYYMKKDGSELRDTNNVKLVTENYVPKLRLWYTGAYQQYLIYKDSKSNKDQTKWLSKEEIVPHISDVYINFGTVDDYLISISMPVIDSYTDNFIGVISMDVPIQKMTEGLSSAKKRAFPNDIDDDVIISVITKLRTGPTILLATTDKTIAPELKKHDITARSLEEVGKYENLSPKAKDALNALTASVEGRNINTTHTISKEEMTNKESLGLERWAFYIVASDVTVQEYSYIAAAVTNSFGAISIILLFVVTWYIRQHIRRANRKLIETEIRIISYLKTKQAKKKMLVKKSPLKRNIANMEKGVEVNPVIESNITKESIDALNQYHIIFTPSIYHKFFIAVIIFGCVLNVNYWFSAGEDVIDRQVNTLVFDLSVELQLKLEAFLKVPMGFVKVMSLFYHLEMLPSGLFDASRDRNRADASNIGMMRTYPKGQRPYFCYIGTEEGSFLGAKIDPKYKPLGVLVQGKDNSTGKDLCTGDPYTVTYFLKTIGNHYHIRDSTSIVPKANGDLSIFSGYMPKQRPWYLSGAKRPYIPSWTPVYEFSSIYPPAIGITAVIGFNHSRRKNEFFGVAAVDYKLTQLNELLESTMEHISELLKDGIGVAYIVENTGNIIALSSDVPLVRLYSENGDFNRVHAASICARRDRFPDECDPAISTSFTELENRLEEGFFTNNLLEKKYPSGLEIEIGRGSELGVMIVRLTTLKSEEGLNWVLVSGFGKRSFLAKFGRYKDLYLITTLGISFFAVLVGFLFSHGKLKRLYEKKKSVEQRKNDEFDKKLVDDEVDFRQRIRTQADIDSEDFFHEFRRLLAPTVLSANLVCRFNGNEAKPPKIYQTFRRLLLDKKEMASSIFKQLDRNGDGKISYDEFLIGLNSLGYQATEAEARLLFAALDKNSSGSISYQEIIEDEHIILVESEATLAEKHRALEYLLLSENTDCNIIDFLFLQRNNDVARIRAYKWFYSTPYFIFVTCSVILNLSLSFLEAPASSQNYFTKNKDEDGRILALKLVTILSILLYLLDLILEIWLFGIYEPDRSLKESRKVKTSHRRGKFDDINKRNVTHQHMLNKIIVGKIILMFFFIIDTIVPVYYTGRGVLSPIDNEDTQLLFLLPYTALLRAFWPMLRFGGIRTTLIIFTKTIYGARAVFFTFFITLMVFSMIGTTLLSNRFPYDTFDSFQSVYRSFTTLFIYMITAENYPDVVYPPTVCHNESIANSREGGVISAECNNTFIHIYTILASLSGTFLIVSLIIAAFEEGFISHMEKNRVDETIRSRMAIIAAFIILDKDNGGSLDKVEFLNFFNGTCNTGRIFHVDDGFELSGADFFQLCEELLHEMKYEKVKEMHMVEFGETDKKLRFDTCTWYELFEYLRTLNINYLPPEEGTFDPSHPGDKAVIEYWRHRGADYHQEHERSKNNEATGKVDNTGNEENLGNKLIRFYEDEMYLITVTCLLLMNCGAVCLYGASSKDNTGTLDTVNGLFVIFWFIELVAKIMIVGYDNYIHVNDDFFKEVKNKVDGSVVVFSFAFLIILATHRLIVLNTGYVFEPWKECLSATNCEVNDWARVIVSLNMLRLFGEFEMVKKIVFCFYVIVPNYFTIIQLTVLLIYSYAVYGCISFGGTFKYLSNYDMGQANFNSMTDSIITLIQLYVGEAWNSVMLAAFDSIGSGAYPFFFSYVIISTLLLTNLLVGVIINGFKETVKVQKHVESKRLAKVPSLLIQRALKEGKISEPRLKFEYAKNNVMHIEHNPEILKRMAYKADKDLYEAAKNTKILQGKKKMRQIELEHNITRASKFERLVERSKDQFGFYTNKSREIITRYAMIVLEEEGEDKKRMLLEDGEYKHNKKNTPATTKVDNSVINKIDMEKLGLG